MKTTTSLTIDTDLMQIIKDKGLNLSSLVNDFLVFSFKSADSLKSSAEMQINEAKAVISAVEKKQFDVNESIRKQEEEKERLRIEQETAKDKERLENIKYKYSLVKDHPAFIRLLNNEITIQEAAHIFYNEGIKVGVAQLNDIAILLNK